jgi:hypothetical protein
MTPVDLKQEEEQMTTHLSLPHMVVDAARIAAPVFQAEQWMYSTDERGTSHIPLEGELAACISRRLRGATDRGTDIGGRFLVHADADTTDVYLKLGSFSASGGE